MDRVRSAARDEWYHSVIDRIDRLCIRDNLKYSLSYYTFLAYHSVFCTLLSILMVFVNAASNPCHGFFSTSTFQTRDIVSVLLSVTELISSWCILAVLTNSKPISESSQRYQRIYFLFLMSTVLGAFLAFFLFLFIILKCQFLNLWRLMLDRHTLQNIQYFNQNPVTCFKKFQLVRLGVLSFSSSVAGGISIIRFLCHDSLWRLITPREEIPLHVINGTREDFFQYYGFYPPGVGGNMNAENNNLPPPRSPNQQQSGARTFNVPALVHSAPFPDVIPCSQLETADNRIQQGSQNVDESLEVLSDCQPEPRAAIDAISTPRPPHLADMEPDVHLWIDELKQYLAMSHDTNCQIAELADSIHLPEVGDQSISCNGLEQIPQQQQSASVSPLGSDLLSRKEFKEKLSRIYEDRISNGLQRKVIRLSQRRGAISAPSGHSALDFLGVESNVDTGEKVESSASPVAVIRPIRSVKQISKEQASSTSMNQARYVNGASFSSTRDSYQAQAEFNGALGSLLEQYSARNEYQRVRRQNQSSASLPRGFSQIGDDIRPAGNGLSSDSDECECANAPAQSWFNHFIANHQPFKSRALSSGESKYQKCHQGSYTVQSSGSDYSSSDDSGPNSINGDREAEGSVQARMVHRFRSIPEVSVTGAHFSGTDENGSRKPVSSKSIANSASVAVNVTNQSDECKDERLHHSSASKSSVQTLQSRRFEFKNRSNGAFSIQIDSDNVDDQEVESIIIGAPSPFADHVDKNKSHHARSNGSSLKLCPSSLAAISPVASANGSDKPVQKNYQRQHSNLSAAAMIQPETCSLSQTDSRDALRGKLPNGKAAGNQFQPESASFSGTHFSSPSKPVSHENKDEQCSGRRDSRTFAMDLDIDESSEPEGSDEREYQENRSRHSSESTDSGLF